MGRKAIAIILAIGVSLLAGAGVFPKLKGTTLSIVFAVFVTFSGTQLLLDRKPSPSRQLPDAADSLAAGGVIGFVSGLVGAGGAFISIPFMTWCNVKPQHAIGTSAAIGLPIALAGTAGYLLNGWGHPNLPPASLGFVHLPALAFVVAMSVTTAPLGAKMAHRLPVAALKRIFAGMIMLLVTKMLWNVFG